jgi:hypothetical protein
MAVSTCVKVCMCVCASLCMWAGAGERGKRPGMVSALQTRINLGFVEAPCCLRDLRWAEFLQPHSHVILHPQTDANMRYQATDTGAGR